MNDTKVGYHSSNTYQPNQQNLASKSERASPQNGYCHEFQIYTRKVEGGIPEEGLGARVVKDLTRKITLKGHHIYMDNFFSSPKLFSDLYVEDIYCCGTVHSN